jgi:hypothetical protein
MQGTENTTSSQDTPYVPPAPQAQIRALEDFVNSSEKVLSEEVKSIIVSISKTGLTCFAWDQLKSLLGYVLNQVISEIVEEERKKRGGDTTELETRQTQLLSALQSFHGPPFTLQRLCELLLNPKLYGNPTKFLNAIEKMFAVSGTIVTLEVGEYATLLRDQAEAYLLASSDSPATSTAILNIPTSTLASSAFSVATAFPSSSSNYSSSTSAISSSSNNYPNSSNSGEDENGGSEESPPPEPMDVEA